MTKGSSSTVSLAMQARSVTVVFFQIVTYKSVSVSERYFSENEFILSDKVYSCLKWCASLFF